MKTKKIFLIITVFLLSAGCVYAANSNTKSDYSFSDLMYGHTGKIWRSYNYAKTTLFYDLIKKLSSSYNLYTAQSTNPARRVKQIPQPNVQVETQNPIPTPVTLGAFITYYESSGRMESKLLSEPDEAGNIYYHYINEDWQDQGYGRVDMTKRRDPLDGELSHTYIYYQDIDGLLQEKKAYSNDSWTTLFATYAYFNNASNRMESKTLASPDTSNNVYYHYLDEDFQSQGYGRVDEQIASEADDDGAIAYMYYYFGSSSTVQYKYCYRNSNFTVQLVLYTYNSSGVLIRKAFTDGTVFSYYYSSGMLESKTLASPDEFGNVYYHYKDENWQSQGYGRVDVSRRQNPLDDALSYAYSYYQDIDGRLQEKRTYSDSYCTTLLATYTYFNNASNRMESKTLVSPDEFGNVYYHYKDENWQGQGYGRVDIYQSAEYDSAGANSFKFTYSTIEPGRVIAKEGYESLENVDALGIIQVIYTYYDNETNRRSQKCVHSSDDGPMFLYHYVDEDFNGQGYGRVDIFKTETSQEENVWAYTYTYSNIAPERVVVKEGYGDWALTNLLTTYVYYDDEFNRAQAKYLNVPDASHGFYYHYINENFAGQGYGRIDKLVTDLPDADGAVAYLFSYHGDTDVVHIKKSFELPEFDILLVVYEYNESGNLITKTYYSADDSKWHKESDYTAVLGDGKTHARRDEVYGDVNLTALVSVNISSYYPTGKLNTKEVYDNLAMTKNTNYVKYTYFGDNSNRMESKLLGAADSGGNIYYEFRNEAFYNVGTSSEYGRVSRSQRQSDGRVFKVISYCGSTDKVSVLEEYTDLTETVRVAAYNYYYDGDEISGVRKIEDGKTTEFDGNFEKPIYQRVADAQDDFEAWWFYGTVYYHFEYPSYWFSYDNVVIKYDHEDVTWYLYERNPDNVWDWGGFPYVMDESQIVLYDAIGGNIISYPNLPPEPLGASMSNPLVSSPPSPPEDEEFNARKEIEAAQRAANSELTAHNISPSSEPVTSSGAAPQNPLSD